VLIQSEDTKEVNSAILKAQGKFPIVGKSKDNDFYKRNGRATKYAGYDDVYKDCKPALIENGLVVEHDHDVKYTEVNAAVFIKEDGSSAGMQMQMIAEVVVKTSIVHAATGQFKTIIASTFPDKVNMHGVMGAVTYLKRYNLTSILDIAVGDEDDDGNSGLNGAEDDQYKRSAGQQRQVTQNRRPPSNNSKPAFTTGSGKPVNMQQATSGLKPEDLQLQTGDLPFDHEGGVTPVEDQDTTLPPPSNEPSQSVDPARPMTDAERKRLGIVDRKMVDTMTTLLKGKGIPPEKMFPYLENVWGYKTISQMKVSDYQPVIDVIEKHPEEIMNFVPEAE
jgi:hypothetical protein